MPSRAWLVNADSGALLYDGPTELRLTTTQREPVVEQAGVYAVATVNGEGVHGIGLRTELTWFVPGSGLLSQQRDWQHDTPPQPIAVQGGAASSPADVVFSVADGRVVKPTVPQAEQLGLAFAYPGGFGYEYSSSDGYTWDRVALFDSSGRNLGASDLKGTILTGSRDIPLVQGTTSDVVFTLDGRKLLELPKSTAMPYTRVIGDRLLVEAGQDRERSWQQFDLRTGKALKTCDVEGLGYYYIASDGDVAVISGDRTPARAIDLDTCEQLWSFPGETQSEGKDVWRVDTTLVQRTNDELFSLVAPS